MTELPTSTRSTSPSEEQPGDSGEAVGSSLLEPTRRPDHIDALYRAACALSGSRHDAEPLVEETFAQVLKRRRLVRGDRELGYLLRAMRNTYDNRVGAATHRPVIMPSVDDTASAASEPSLTSSKTMRAVASAPAAYRDAVIAVDIMGMSYRQAARSLRASEAAIATHLCRGRQHVAQVLTDAAQAS
jgi:RNA polymerase sigma-70 factor, ECF subfamily